MASIRRLEERRDPPEHRLGGLRVALVHDWLTGMRGGEKCLEAFGSLFPDATIHTLIHDRGSLSPALESMRIETSPLQRIPGVHRHYRHFLPVMPLAARAWRPRDVDLVVSLSHCVAKSVAAPPGVPHICYCFTPMRYAWDGRAMYLDGWTDRPIRKAVAGLVLNQLQRWDLATAHRVTHFVAISQTVRERIARCYGRESHVIEPPVDTDYFTPAPIHRPRESFYLVVSALVPYKRVDQAVAACTRAGKPLVVIGKGPELARLASIAGPTVRFLGWQSDDVIRDHLRRCRALLFPGVEDFGIVPIEALACGAPVIALGEGGAAETVDQRVGWLYHEPTAPGLLDAIEHWESQGCLHDPDLARQKAERFAPHHFRRRVLEYLADVVGSSGSHIPAPHRRSASGTRSGQAMEQKRRLT